MRVRKSWIELICGLTALYHLLIASRLLSWLGYFVPRAQHRAISLSLALILIYVLFRMKGKPFLEHDQEAADQGNGFYLPWYDFLLLFMGLIGTGFVALFYDRVLEYGFYGYLDLQGVVLAVLLMVSLLEALRRVVGWILPMLIILLLLVTRFQNFLPGVLEGKGYLLDRLGYAVYVGQGGIFGLPLGVAATIIIVFLVYANLLEQAGVGKWFMDLAMAVTGRTRGGPAKAAVLASAFFGMISGSPSGNVATTGTFTIPLMKKVGYSPAFAGATEAVSSTGGQILPPVMGAIAFVMAEWLGISYAEVVKAALVPAILYFVVVFVSVHLQAVKDQIRPFERDQLPALRETFIKGWFNLIPIIALLYFLLGKGYSPDLAGIYSFPFLLASSFLSRDRQAWLMPSRIWRALVKSARGWLVIAAVTASVGMLIGSLELSGLALKFSKAILYVSGENLILTLVMVGLASLILGMGLDSLPAYMTLAALTAPALITLGLPDITAHLFVVYWGLASFITPPVCIAVYVACGISGSKLWETGWEAVRLGIAVYIIPYAFALNPALMLRGSPVDVAMGVTTALLGATFVAAAVRGYALVSMNPVQRILFFAAGLLLVAPGLTNALLGLLLVLVSLFWQWKFHQRTVISPGS